MTPEKIILHCTDTENFKHVDIEKIRENHKARGFKDIGYHFIIQPDGEAIATRPTNEMGEHCSGENWRSIAICLAGKDKYTQRQFDSLRYKIDGLMLQHDIKKWRFFCHYQFKSAQDQGKTCPNMWSHDLLYWYLTKDDESIKKYIGG